MSDKFNGFSLDEINKVSGGKKTTITKTITPSEAQLKQAFRGQHTGIRRMPEKWSKTTNEQLRKQQAQKNQASTMPMTTVGTGTTDAGIAVANKQVKKPQQQQKQMPQTQKDDTITEISLNDGLSKSLENVLFYQPFKKPTATTESDVIAKKSTEMDNASAADDSSLLKLPTSNTETMTSSSSDDSSILPMALNLNNNHPGVFTTSNGLSLESPFKGISLKDFESHRKMIQEQNKQKKDLLYKAIEHHSKKTAAETRKIEEIKSELAKLDNDLAVDVAILRKQIDNACVHFSNVEKQYMKVEAQFLKAKLDLHNAAEKKELLTEHLCTVIAHNEDRKAQKLTELMQKVGLTPSGDYEETPHEAIQAAKEQA